VNCHRHFVVLSMSAHDLLPSLLLPDTSAHDLLSSFLTFTLFFLVVVPTIRTYSMKQKGTRMEKWNGLGHQFIQQRCASAFVHFLHNRQIHLHHNHLVHSLHIRQIIFHHNRVAGLRGRSSTLKEEHEWRNEMNLDINLSSSDAPQLLWTSCTKEKD
jgi:hypothetical protein